LTVTVNGDPQKVEIDMRARLVDVLRDTLQLTGTHVGCGTGNCGACTVILDGDTAKSCCILAVDVDGAVITTIEGVAPAGKLSPVQSAFSDCHGLQCGFCTPGMILSTMQLLKNNPNPDNEDDIREAIAGNICRCTGYVNIVASIREAARRVMKDTTPEKGEINATVQL
jgi:carbon-monoxide dehydrogenase small subunit